MQCRKDRRLRLRHRALLLRLIPGEGVRSKSRRSHQVLRRAETRPTKARSTKPASSRATKTTCTSIPTPTRTRSSETSSRTRSAEPSPAASLIGIDVVHVLEGRNGDRRSNSVGCIARGELNGVWSGRLSVRVGFFIEEAEEGVISWHERGCWTAARESERKRREGGK
jgi:hypothetical protein